MDKWQSNPGWSWLLERKETRHSPSDAQVKDFLTRLREAKDGECIEGPEQNIFSFQLGLSQRPSSAQESQ